MSLDRIAYIKDVPVLAPTLHQELSAFANKHNGQAKWDEASQRFILTLPDGEQKHEESGTEAGWIEVYQAPDYLDVITRLQPPEINLLAATLFGILVTRFQLEPATLR